MRLVAVLLALSGVAACSAGPNSVPERSALPRPTSSASAAVPSFRFAVIGDWGAGTSAQAAIARAMCAARARDPFSVVVTTGDNFYSPDGTATAKNFTEPERCLIRGAIAWRATWGNHDAGHRSTSAVLDADRTYRWSAPGADFFMLDSNDATSPAQRSWLRSALASSTARAKIVVFHHPPYTAGLHAPNANVLSYWVPLFERYGVTLVLNGHNHDYEHLVESGIHYVVTGGGGQQLYPCVRAPAGLERCISQHHFLIVTVAGDHVAVRAEATAGRTLDAFDIAL